MSERKTWNKSFTLFYLYLLFSLSLFSCKRVEKKVLSEEDFLAPFGQGSVSLSDYIKNYSVQREEYEKQFWLYSEENKILVHIPQKVSKITIHNTEYEIPEKWEGYIVKIDSPKFDFVIFYCDIDKMVCEGAEILKKGLQDEYFFVVTAGILPVIFIFEVQQVVSGGEFCLFGSCGQVVLIPRFYICPENLNHLICKADEFSYLNPVTVSDLSAYTISITASDGAQSFQDGLTLKVGKINQIRFGSEELYIETGNNNWGKRVISFYYERIYEVELYLSGSLYFVEAGDVSSPNIEVVGCDKNDICWEGFQELSISIFEPVMKEKEIQNYAVKFLVPSSSEINYLRIKKYSPIF